MNIKAKSALTVLLVLAVMLMYVSIYASAEAKDEIHDMGGEIVFAKTSAMLDASSDKWVVKATKEWNYPGSSKWPCKKWVAYSTADKDDTITAYCLQPDLVGPVDSVGKSHTYDSSDVTTSVESDVKKCLYYCYGYPGWDELKAVIDKEMKGTAFSPTGTTYASSSQYYMCCHILLAMFYYDDTSKSSKAFDGIDNDAYEKERTAFRNVYDAVKNFDAVPTGDMSIRLKKGDGSYSTDSINISADEMKYHAKAVSTTVGGVSYDIPAKCFTTPGITIDCNSKDRVRVKILSSSKLKVLRGEKILTYTPGEDSAYVDDNDYVQLKDGDIYWYEVDETRTGAYRGSVKSSNGSFIPYMLKCTGKQNIAFAASESKDSISMNMAFPTGTITVRKMDDGSLDASKDNPAYDLSGAEFKVMYDGNMEGSIKVSKNSDGTYTGSLSGLHYGTYTIEETKAPKGYLKYDGAEEVSLTSEKSDVSFSDTPILTPFDLKIAKVDKESGEAMAYGDLSFEGAIYEVAYFKAGDSLAYAKWYLATDENGHAAFTKEYLAEGYDSSDLYSFNESPAMPYGEVTIEEIEAPAGYLKDSEVKKLSIDGPERYQYTYTSQEPLERGDFSFQKVEKYSKEPMAGVVFKITDNATGESHVVVTDENGYFKSSSSKNKTNKNDQAVSISDDGYVIDEDKLDAYEGIWFGEGKAEDGAGALPYGSYTLEELSSSANRAKVLAEPITFDISEDGEIKDLGVIENGGMEINTHACDFLTDTQEGFARDDEVIVDEIEYEHAVPGTRYMVTTSARNAATGEVISDDGEAAEEVSYFMAESESGAFKARLKCDLEGFEDRDIVIFETIGHMNENGEYIEDAFEEDMLAEEQKVHLVKPEIRTEAADLNTGENMAMADDDVTIIDHVSYEGLVPGKEYHLTGTLMDKESGREILSNGKLVTGESSFVAGDESGICDVSFTFDGLELKGKTVVVFESLDMGGVELAVHADIDDEGQSIIFPEIGTTAVDSDTGEHMALADESVEIVDTVRYSNLIPGKKYEIEGVLMDKERGEALIIDESKVISKKEFIPEKRNGSVDVSFKFSGVNQEGRTVVAFETLYRNGNEIAVHAEIDDEDQSVDFPMLTTTASANLSMTEVVDKVQYEGLVPGKDYVIYGSLMDKESRSIVVSDDAKVTGEMHFTPEKESGMVSVPFEFKKDDVVGKTCVVFERVYMEGDDDKLIAVHEDYDAVSQTVEFEEMKIVETGISHVSKLLVLLMVLTAICTAVLMFLRRKMN